MTTKREEQYKQCIKEFYPIESKVLENFPEELTEFNKWWEEGNYKRAYSYFMIKRNKEDFSEKELKIDEDFFWLFVN